MAKSSTGFWTASAALLSVSALALGSPLLAQSKTDKKTQPAPTVIQDSSKVKTTTPVILKPATTPEVKASPPSPTTSTKTVEQLRNRPATQSTPTLRARDRVQLNPVATQPLKPGFVGGINDVNGIADVVKDLTRTALPDNLFGSRADRDRFRELGVDFAELKGLIEGNLFSPYIIERIEFIPGLEIVPGENGIVTDFTNPGEYDGGDFGAGLPSRDSLVGHRVWGMGHNYANGSNDHMWVFSDGSTSTYNRVLDENGNFVSASVTVFDYNGNLEHQRVIEVDGAGNSVVVASDPLPPNKNHSEAYEAEMKWRAVEEQRDRARTGGGDTSGDTGGDTKPDGGSKPEGGTIDKFQPADGSGTFCPMALDICRRQMEKAIASGQTVLAGMVLINPADPDGVPSAPRLGVDTGGLVMDPEGRIRDGAVPDKARLTQVILPVWVNPPGPGD